jgi:hypothetical protein
MLTLEPVNLALSLSLVIYGGERTALYEFVSKNQEKMGVMLISIMLTNGCSSI